MSFYSRYRGRCSGRLWHFLEHYCGVHTASHAKCDGEDGIRLYGKLIATYTWSDKFGEKDVPIFEFKESKNEYDRGMSDLYTQKQVEKQKEAIADGFWWDEPRNKEEVSARVVEAMNKEAYRDARLWSGILECPCVFFVADRNSEEKNLLYFSTGKQNFYWDVRLGGWLRDS